MGGGWGTIFQQREKGAKLGSKSCRGPVTGAGTGPYHELHPLSMSSILLCG